MFTLAKWYLDVVTDDGTVVVGYSARLIWGRARLGYASLLVSAAGEPVKEESAFGDPGDPVYVLADATLTWEHPALAVTGRWRGLATPIAHCLLHTADGDVTWDCVMPQARVDLRIGDRRVTGIGYVERLTLTLPPWRLPFHQLKWGRFASEAHHVIWIDWHGADSRQFAWHDGAQQANAVLDGGRVRGLADDAVLELEAARDICARPALARVVDRLPAPLTTIASPLSAMFEHKMVAPGRLVTPGQPADRGWVVFEEVQW